MAKANTEKLIYEEAATDGSFEAMAILPLHVIGPLLAINNDQALELADSYKTNDARAALQRRARWKNAVELR